MISPSLRGRIEFLCAPEDRGVIAEPFAASEYVPDWFKRLPAVDRDKVSVDDQGITVKRCLPFLDAMGLGWILPLAATVRLEVRDGGTVVDAGWDHDRTMVSFHAATQVAGHPRLPRPPCKLHNHWTIRTPRGWSCLFVPLLNRPNDVIEIVAGVVDTDRYVDRIHFPFFVTAADGRYVLEKGLPLVQVIPFRRDASAIEGVVRSETEAEAAEAKRIGRAVSAGDGWYRLHARSPRKTAP
jgi:hypothetical protein